MERLGCQNVYFTLHATGSILSATIQDGIVIHENILPRTSCPHNWIGALQEMAATDSSRGTELLDIEEHQNERVRSLSMSRTPSGMLAADTSSYNEPSSMDTRSLRSPSNSAVRPNTIRTTSFPSCPTLNETRHEEERTAKWSSLRMTKLLRLLETLRNQPMPTMEDHNEQVHRLYSGSHIPHAPRHMSIMQFAGVLSHLSNMSNTSGFVYGMLSWEIFKREEDRLVLEEKISMVLAAKQLNQKMTEVLQHRGKAKDWASDGRKAARMVFRALERSSNAVKTFSLFLLGRTCSLDSMLKIAHFPVLREYFQGQFEDLVAKMTAQWETAEAEGYKVFDYVEFLSPKGPLITRSVHNTRPSDSVLDRLTPITDGSASESCSRRGTLFQNSSSSASTISEVDFCAQDPMGVDGHLGNLATFETEISYDLLHFDDNFAFGTLGEEFLGGAYLNQDGILTPNCSAGC